MANHDNLIEDAICEWLSARKGFLANRRGGIEAYRTADQRLLAAFATDWNADDPMMFGKAYDAFRRRLIADANRQPVNPPRDRARTCDEA